MDPTIDYFMNSGQQGWQAYGNVASVLLRNNMDPNVLRPFVGKDGRSYMLRNTQMPDGTIKPTKILTNAPASLRFQDWRLFDETVIQVAKPRLQAIADLRGRGLEVILPNGMAHTVYTYENMSDISGAIISMSPTRRSDSDRPVFDLVNLPLPLIHKDINFDLRQVMASRNGNTPLDTATLTLAARRVAEAAEQLLLGVTASYAYGGGTIYGYLNYPKRMTKTITKPTAGGWTPATMVTEILAMRQQSVNAFHYGPWVLYNSPNLDLYLDTDYRSTYGDNTLRDRIRQINGIEDIRTLDYLANVTGTPYILMLVSMEPDVIREVVGMEITTVQWESYGGFELNFKVICLMVPQLRCDQNSNTGIVHGSAAYP